MASPAQGLHASAGERPKVSCGVSHLTRGLFACMVRGSAGFPPYAAYYGHAKQDWRKLPKAIRRAEHSLRSWRLHSVGVSAAAWLSTKPFVSSCWTRRKTGGIESSLLFNSHLELRRNSNRITHVEKFGDPDIGPPHLN